MSSMANEFSVKELTADIKKAIAELKADPQVENVGVVTRVGDGVAWIWGLRECGFNEMLEIESSEGSVPAFALNLGEEEIGAVLLGSDVQVKAGAKAKRSGKVLEVPVGPELIGR